RKAAAGGTGEGTSMKLFDLYIHGDHPALRPKGCRWQASAEPLDDDILIIRNGIPHLRNLATLAEARPELLAKSQVVDGNGKAYEDSSHRRNSQLGLSDNRLRDQFSVYNKIFEAVESTFIRVYKEMINPFATAASSLGYNLLRYQPGEFFDT